MATQETTPARAYRLTLQLGADTAQDMAWALHNLADRIERGEVTAGYWGGFSDGAIYELLVDPEQTHERYFAEVNAYLAARRGAKR